MVQHTAFRTALSVAALCALCLAPIQAEEHHEEKPKAEAPSPTDPKKEAHDAMAEGTKGVSDGVILSLDKDKGKLVLNTPDGNLLFVPHWRGGMPKDGGGPDKAVMEKLGALKAGQRVRIAWTWQERRRIDEIGAGK